MSMSKHLGTLIASALLALLVFAPGEPHDARAGTVEPPPNDNIADATVISELPFSDSVDTTGATNESDEPTSDCVPSDNTTASPTATVWYRFETEEELVLIVDNLGSDYGTIINLFKETAFGPQFVTCQASHYGFQIPHGRQGPLILETQVVVRTVPGTTYLIQLGGSLVFGDSTGGLMFNLRSVQPPANDNFGEATELGALPAYLEQDVTAGTIQAEEPSSTCMEGFTPRETVWYRLQAGRDSFYRFDANDPVGSSSYAIAIFRGEELGTLEEVRCGSVGGNYSNTRFGLQTEADEGLYVQVVSYTPGRRPIFGPDGTEVLDERGLRLDVQQVKLPACAPPVLRFEDERDDVTVFSWAPGEDHDILSVGRSQADGYVCFWVEFKDPVEPPPAIYYPPSVMRIEFDLDGKIATGLPSRLCAGGELLGYDAYLSLEWESGQLLDIYSDELSSDERNTLSGAALFSGQIMTFVAPARILGDDAYHFVWQTNDLIDGGRDCAPNRGFYSTARLGDANCDGQATAIDAALVLQFEARLILELGCREVADVDADGTVGSIDAALILQLDAGLISFLPAAASEAIAAVSRATAETLSVPDDQIVVRSVSAETWPNGCLGLPEPGEACTEALVDGYRIRLKGWLVPLPAPTPPSPTAVPAEFYSWRTNLDGSQIRLEGIAIP